MNMIHLDNIMRAKKAMMRVGWRDYMSCKHILRTFLVSIV